MGFIELSCAIILLIQIAFMLSSSNARARTIRHYGLIAIASLVAENTCIRAYQFYGYHPDWSLFVDQMPITVALIWPCVILSARELVTVLVPLSRRPSVWVACVVFFDAWLIEPIAVHANLWQW